MACKGKGKGSKSGSNKGKGGCKGKGVAPMQAGLRTGQSAGPDIALHGLGGRPVLFDKIAGRSAPRKGFQPQLAGAGKQVEHPRAGQIELQDIKNRFFDFIGGRPGRHTPGRRQPLAPQASADDPHLLHQTFF